MASEALYCVIIGSCHTRSNPDKFGAKLSLKSHIKWDSLTPVTMKLEKACFDEKRNGVKFLRGYLDSEDCLSFFPSNS